MSNDNDLILDLGPLEQFDIQDDGLMLYNGSALTRKDLEKIARIAKTQTAGVLAIQEKTKRAMITIGEITVSGVQIFDDTYGKLLKIRNKHRQGSERYRVVASFIERVSQENGLATMQAMRIGEKWVLQVLYASPFPPPETKRKRPKLTWLGRLLVSNSEEYED